MIFAVIVNRVSLSHVKGAVLASLVGWVHASTLLIFDIAIEGLVLTVFDCAIVEIEAVGTFLIRSMTAWFPRSFGLDFILMALGLLLFLFFLYCSCKLGTVNTNLVWSMTAA